MYSDADGRANLNRAVDVAVIKVLVLFCSYKDGMDTLSLDEYCGCCC